MIDQKRLKELVKLMVDNSLTELDLQDDKQSVTLRRSEPGAPVQYVQSVPSVPAAQPAPAAGAPSANNAPAVSSPEASTAEQKYPGLVAVKSPMVGTFYHAATPEADPFIKVGDKINEETVVCIIEAMKVFNEIKAEITGTVEHVLVENGQAIEFDQPLFMVKP